MAVGDVYLLKMFQDFFSVKCLNVFAYQQQNAAAETDALGCFTAFDQSILINWKSSVVSQVTIPNVEVFQIASPSDFKDGAPVNNAGTRAAVLADLMPAFVAASYRSNRNGAGSRRTYKRFTGLKDVDVDNNALSVAFLALPGVIALLAALPLPIANATGSTYVPVQLKSDWVLGAAPTINFPITSYSQPTLSSQVSRKP